MLDEQRLNLFESRRTNLAIRFQLEHVRQSKRRRQNDSADAEGVIKSG